MLRKGILIIALFICLSGCSQEKLKGQKNWPIETFEFTQQDGKMFGLKELKGKIWISNFIFTSCTDVCMPMTFNMSKLQKMVEDEGLKNVEFVSFSVDPEVDTPEVLTNFALPFKVNFQNWHFLTGYNQERIEQFALINFKALVKKPESEDQVIHGTDIYLVDQNGKIVKYYSGLSDMPYDEIINDMKALQ